jgi:D-tyrosyl-tRNA(Tyr) deacylase
MRVLLQRVREASVAVDGQTVAGIGQGYLLLVGIGHEDAREDAGGTLAAMARKIMELRILPDTANKMNRSLREAGGEILAVSQFTLHADCRRGRRPSFANAAPPEAGRRLFEQFVQHLRDEGAQVQTGVFGAMMDVALVNDGPVTIWLDSEEILT